MRILICATGSVACIKMPLILELFKEHEVKVVATEAAFLSMPPLDIKVLRDADEMYPFPSAADSTAEDASLKSSLTVESSKVVIGTTAKRPPILHIQLSKWPDIILIAPLTANTLAKLATGICDNLVTQILRCRMKIPILVCPAMNTEMYYHPLTAQQLGILQGFGYTVMEPIVKMLACGDYGTGALPEPIDIVAYCQKLLDGRTLTRVELDFGPWY